MSTSNESPETSSSHLRAGLQLLGNGDFANAIAQLEPLVRRCPSDLAAVRALTSAYLAARQTPEARKILADYSEAHPMCEQGHRLAALLEWKLGQRGAAVNLLQRALKRLPHSPLLRQQLQILQGAMGQVICDPAQDSQSPSRDPDFLDRLVQDPKLLEGILRSNSDPQDPMLRDLENRLSTLLESQPGHPDRQVMLAKLRLMLGNLQGAMLAVQLALRANPKYVEALRLKAEICAQTGNDAEALQVLQGLVSRGIQWPDLHCRIAELHQRLGQHEAARSHLYRAMEKAPGYRRAEELLACSAA